MGNLRQKEDLKWWQKKVRGWIVPFWYSDTPLCSKKYSDLSEEQKDIIANKIRKGEINGLK